jgi:putative drug exporter of the RND superfamily
MAKMARWCYTHRRMVLTGWLVGLVVVVAAAGAAGTVSNTNFSLSGTDSQAAVNLLTKNFKAASGESDQVVIAATHGNTVTSPQVKQQSQAMLAKVAKVPGVATVVSPYSTAGAKQISKNGDVAFATVYWKMSAANVTKADADKLIHAATKTKLSGANVYLGGNSIENAASSGPGISVFVGVVAALIVLLLVFGGALVASITPLLVTGISLIISVSMIGLLTHVIDIPSVSSELAVLIGLGVGVDYGLFVISRHRAGVKAGMGYEDAVAQAVNTSGRTVLFAGTTVCIALLGQIALGVTFLNGLSIASALAVAMTMFASLTFLPAFLGVLGSKTLSRRERKALAGGSVESDISPFWLRWARTLQRQRRAAALLSLAVVVVLAVPITGLRLGSPDAGSDPAGSLTRNAYDALAKGFGPGFNGPLQLAAKVPNSQAKSDFTKLVATVSHEHGVASVVGPQASPNGQAALAIVYPTTSPQAEATVNLVNHLRDDTIPAARGDSGLQVHVGGATATNIDFAHVLLDKLPIFITVVVVLAFILLTAVFRSLLIPLVAALLNLLSIGAALGAVNAVFNYGWLKGLFGLSATSPVEAFLPVLMFSVLFGLSMDYEVYLVSRIHEEWSRLRRRDPSADPVAANHEAIIDGQAKGGRIITAAAGIMICVFASFLLSNNATLKQFGFGLGFSVLIDAFIIRSIFVPAVMHVIGPANWKMPAWLDRILPNLSVEAHEDEQDAVKV